MRIVIYALAGIGALFTVSVAVALFLGATARVLKHAPAKRPPVDDLTALVQPESWSQADVDLRECERMWAR